MNTERKLIFFDIDGTIVTEARDGRIIPDSTRTALRKLQTATYVLLIPDERLLRLTNLFYSCKWMGLSVAVVHILRITIMYLLNIRYRLILVIAY